MINRNERIQNPEELQRSIFENLMSGVWTALPGIIDSVGPDGQNVSVIPAIRAKVTDQNGIVTDVELPLLVDVNVLFQRAGGFALTFPIKAGDECLVIFSSRCIDSWWQSGGVQNQAELRMHDLSDGFCLLAPTSNPKKLSNVSTTDVQLRNLDGTSIVSINPDGTIGIATGVGWMAFYTNGNKQIIGPETSTSGHVKVGTGATGTFTTTDSKTVTVQDGIITEII
jgi:hypothetical protein